MERLPSGFFAAASLAGSLAAAGTAFAHDAARSLPPSPLGIDSPVAVNGALAVAAAAPVQLPLATSADDTPSPVDVQRLLTERPAPVTCANPCGGPKNLLTLPDDLLRELGAMPLLATVIVPVTRGVTIETGEGKPTLTLAVKPTKITRGSGLVAIGRF